MADEELRLAGLVDALAAAQNGTQVPIITHQDAATIVAALHDEIEAATTARAELAAQQGLRIACAPGCNGCCENTVVTLEPEAIAVAQWLEQPENRDAREHFERSYPAWRARIGSRLGELGERQRTGDLDGFEAILLGLWRERIVCAFDREGECTVYPVRPNVCRICVALDTADLCRGDSPGHPTVVEFPPLDDLNQRIRPLIYSMHVAVGGVDTGPAPLCAAVHRLLGQAGARRPARTAAASSRGKVGRNDPCPCGSGKKYKRCCGR